MSLTDRRMILFSAGGALHARATRDSVEGVEAFRVTGRLSDSDRTALMGRR
jgi:hypothetical protein